MVADEGGQILDCKEYYAPIITPHEAEIAFCSGSTTQWDGTSVLLGFDHLRLSHHDEGGGHERHLDDDDGRARGGGGGADDDDDDDNGSNDDDNSGVDHSTSLTASHCTRGLTHGMCMFKYLVHYGM